MLVHSFVVVLTTTLLLAQGTQVQVVPAAFTVQDAVRQCGVPGVSDDGRSLTLVGQGHLASLIGRTITALEFRRSAADETYAGAAPVLAVTLSTSPRSPLACSNRFVDNVGPDAITVFQGTVVVPTSPPAPGPLVDWSPQNTIRIAFQQPFPYQGGTLCIDVVGTRTPGQSSLWWAADAVCEDLSGTVVQLGNGCGIHGQQWSHVDQHSLLPGGYAAFSAHGTSGGLAFAIFGGAAATPVPLTALGLPADASCVVNMDLGAGVKTRVATFQPQTIPILAPRGGEARTLLRIPNETWVFGLQLSTQWLDLAQPATSNTVRWTVASAIPTLDLALVAGHPLESTGNVTVHIAHVLRFEHQAP